MHQDQDLRKAFEALGGDAGVPSFAQLTSPEALGAARWRRRRRQAALALAVVTLPLLALQARHNDEINYEEFTAMTGIDLGEVTWEAPSDFLLDTPGRELLEAVPIIDTRLP